MASIKNINGRSYKYHDANKLINYDLLPYCMRAHVNSLFQKSESDEKQSNELIKEILSYPLLEKDDKGIKYIPFRPTRVVLQDFSGIPIFTDLACLREKLKDENLDPNLIQSSCHIDIVVDHPIDIFRKSNLKSEPNSQTLKNNLDACLFHGNKEIYCIEGNPLTKNQELEFERNKERFVFLKWFANSFKNVQLIPPGNNILHQLLLASLSQVVMLNDEQCLIQDVVAGVDSHLNVLNGLGIYTLGVISLEAEAVILGQPLMIPLPHVIGCKLVGKATSFVTSTDVVLGIIKILKNQKLNHSFVEFFGSGVKSLLISERMVISNMCFEYAQIGYFPFDSATFEYFISLGKSSDQLTLIKEFLSTLKLFSSEENKTPEYSQIIEIDLSQIETSCSGPSNFRERNSYSNLKQSFNNFLFEISKDSKLALMAKINLNEIPRIPRIFMNEKSYFSLSTGSIILSSITPSTNGTSSSVLMAAGILAKNAFRQGLKLHSQTHATIYPGNTLAMHYLKRSSLDISLQEIGFSIVGYANCSQCETNSSFSISTDFTNQNDIVTVGLFSGSSNNIDSACKNQQTQANYLMSPLMVIAYSLAGTIDIDLTQEPLGINKNGEEVFLNQLWPNNEINDYENKIILPTIISELDLRIQKENVQFTKLENYYDCLFPWNNKSTYVQCPPFVNEITLNHEPSIQSIENAYAILLLGDDVHTDFISPAGSIARNTPAANLLQSYGLTAREFNSYGSRCGNYKVMARSTYSNTHLLNKFLNKPTPKALHVPTNKILDIFEVAEMYNKEKLNLIILAGKNYGCGSRREWAVKGPSLLGVKCIIAESFDKTHRQDLFQFGIMPLELVEGLTFKSMKITSRDIFNINFINLDLSIDYNLVNIKTNNGIEFKANLKIDTFHQINLLKNKGMLEMALKQYLLT